MKGAKALHSETRDAGTDGGPGPGTAALLDEIRASLAEHKARDVVVIDLAGKSDIADFMVIASGGSQRQVATMAEKLARIAKAHGIKGLRPEGLAKADWVLLDVGDIVVHLFRPEVRDFYGLEKMWSTGMPAEREQVTA